MVQAIIAFEDTIKRDYLQNDWWYWSSPSTAAKITTHSALALCIYALDSALSYDKPLVRDATETLEPNCGVEEEAPSAKNLANQDSPTQQNTPEQDPADNIRTTRTRASKHKKVRRLSKFVKQASSSGTKYTYWSCWIGITAADFLQKNCIYGHRKWVHKEMKCLGIDSLIGGVVVAIGLTTTTQYSGDPFPELIRVSTGLIVTGLSGNIRTHIFPPRRAFRVIARRPASICLDVIQAGSSATDHSGTLETATTIQLGLSLGIVTAYVKGGWVYADFLW